MITVRAVSIKASIAARFDRRYARTAEAQALRRRLAVVEGRLREAQSTVDALRSSLHALQRQTRDLGREISVIKTTSGDALRLATEGARGIEQLLEVELLHQQRLDGLSGEGQ